MILRQVKLILIAFLFEAVPSIVLWLLAPTDGIRVWYPNVWAYIGTHALPWALVLAGLLWLWQDLFSPGKELLRGMPASVKHWLGFCLILYISELAATTLTWLVTTRGMMAPKIWASTEFLDYLRIRESASFFVLIFMVVSVSVSQHWGRGGMPSKLA